MITNPKKLTHISFIFFCFTFSDTQINCLSLSGLLRGAVELNFSAAVRKANSPRTLLLQNNDFDCFKDF